MKIDGCLVSLATLLPLRIFIFETSACAAFTPPALSGNKLRKTGPGGRGSILSLFETRWVFCLFPALSIGHVLTACPGLCPSQCCLLWIQA